MTDITETQPKPSLIPIALKWGLLTGLVSVIYALFGFITENFGNFLITLGVSLIISIIGIVLALKEFRAKNGGYMTYGQGLLLGMSTMIIASILSGLFAMLYMQFVDQSIAEKMVDATLEQMSGFGIDESALEEQRDKILAENTPMNQLWGALKNGVFGGLILSLIISAIMKNNRPEFE
jgi:hypothetical protein